jgi:hypothetical protein
MHKHFRGCLIPQRQEAEPDGGLARWTADNGNEALGVRSRRALQKLGIVGVDGDNNRADQRMGEKDIQSMGDNGTATDALILLRTFGLTGARASASGNDYHPDPAAWGHRLLFACLTHSDRS